MKIVDKIDILKNFEIALHEAEELAHEIGYEIIPSIEYDTVHIDIIQMYEDLPLPKIHVETNRVSDTIYRFEAHVIFDVVDVSYNGIWFREYIEVWNMVSRFVDTIVDLEFNIEGKYKLFD